MRLYAKSGVTIHIGRAGENYATEVYFDITSWVNDFPNGTPTLVVQQNGATYMQTSHVEYGPKTADGKFSSVYVIWDTTKSNNATAGMGKCQLFYAQKDASVTNGERIVKSAIYDIIVTNSLGDGEDEPPAAYKSWVDDITQRANDIVSNIGKAEKAATDAITSAANAKVSETNAAASAKSAHDDAVLAGSYRKEVEDNAKAADASAKAAAKSEANAKLSENAAKLSETNAKASEVAAKNSENAAKASQDAAKDSENAAKLSETNAKTSETNAKNSENNAKTSETNAANSAAAAKASEDNAKASENAASLSETNAKASEVAAKASEDAARLSETNAAASESAAATSEANAKTSEKAAKDSEDAAKASEDAAKLSETNAATSEANAKTSEEAAKNSEDAAADSATLAESWAVGGTGTRTGEDSNNAKFWADVAATVVSKGGVATWNGRGGNVMPQAGDYTPDMVGAISKEDVARGFEIVLLPGEDNWIEESQESGRILRYQIVSHERFVDSGYSYFIAPVDTSLDDYLDAFTRPVDITTTGQIKFYADYVVQVPMTVKIVRIQVIDE